MPPSPGGPRRAPLATPNNGGCATALETWPSPTRRAPLPVGLRSRRVLAMLPDLQRRLVATLWNTGARINEALALTPASFELDGQRPFVVLRTLKQRNRARGGPGVGTELKRLVPLLDPAYAQLAREYLSTFKLAKSAPDLARDRPDGEELAERGRGGTAGEGVQLMVPLTPHVFRHSFAMHRSAEISTSSGWRVP